VNLIRNRRGLVRAVAAVLVLPLAFVALAGCGRKGPLDPPPDNSISPAPQPAAPQGFIDPTDPTGQAQPKLQAAPPPPPPKKTFLLDPLIQ
jgi:predicted small lipoprotein YifL